MLYRDIFFSERLFTCKMFGFFSHDAFTRSKSFCKIKRILVSLVRKTSSKLDFCFCWEGFCCVVFCIGPNHTHLSS